MPRPGPPPKDPRKRARVNADPAPVRFVENKAIPQPSLVDMFGPQNPMTKTDWHQPTLDLWAALATFPTTESLQEAQWRLLGRAMMYDGMILEGHMKAASEQRMLLSKFGVAPDDVARLRIFFADAEEKEDKGAERKARKESVATGSRARYGGLRAVND